MKPMQVEPIPFEPGRFWVQSSSRLDIRHVVDLNFEGRIACSCEAYQAKGVKRCKHILAVEQQERKS